MKPRLFFLYNTITCRIMANLGTLEFSVKLKNETEKQAEDIKRNLLTKLSIDYDKSSYETMINNLRNAISKESFQVKIEADANAARQAVQSALTSVGKSGQAVVGLDLGSLQGVSGIKAQIISLDRDILMCKANIADYKKELDSVSKTYGKTSAQAKQLQDALKRENAVLSELTRQRKVAGIEQREMSLAISESRKATKAATEAAKENSKATKERTASHIRLNGELLNGIRVSADLKDAFTSLYSVHMLREFLENVIEIGGQLEKQRVSMGAILGDTAKANVLFEQIKEMAVRSPFGVVELDQYTKQLAAYGFEYNELYDMIKRLADISAGAGQDISRLTLALGHVKSQTYLTGYTLRQFAMNNIPMLKMLSEYYSELEGTMVTTAQVQKRISEHKVSYEDVIEQIRRLTDEGGKFYNLQDKIADTVAAKWKNLRDAFSIMYGDMAEGQIGDALKVTAEWLTKMALSGEKLVSVILALAAGIGTYKAALVALSVYQNASIWMNEVSRLLMARNAIQSLTVATRAQIVAQHALNAAMKWNWVAIGVAALAALASAYLLLHESTRTLEEVQQDFNEEIQKEHDLLEREQKAAQSYAKTMTDTTKSMEARLSAYENLHKLYPEYFNDISKEVALNMTLEESLKRVNEEARKKALQQAQNRLNEAWWKRRVAENEFTMPTNFTGAFSWLNPLYNFAGIGTEARQAEIDALKEEERLAEEYYNSLKEYDDKITTIQQERWYKDSSALAGSFKNLLPNEGETRDDYFSRIKSHLKDLQGQIEDLNKTSVAAQEVLPGLQDELAATENIYYNALGGAKVTTKAETNAEKEAEKARKEAEKLAKEQLKLAVKEMEDYIKQESGKFNLYKTLFEQTGDKEFASNAFKNGQIWDSYAEGLRDKLEEIVGSPVKDWNMTRSLAESLFGEDTPALKLYQEIVEHIGNNWTESLKEAGNAMQAIMTNEQKIARLESQIAEWRADVSGADHTAQIAQATDEITKLKTELFATLPVYDQIFGDTAKRSIASIKEGIRQLDELIANGVQSDDKKSVISSYIDSDGEKHDVKITISKFGELREQGEKLFDAWRDKNPFSLFKVSWEKLMNTIRSDDASVEDKTEAWAEFSLTLASCADIAEDLAGKLSDVLDAAGLGGLSELTDYLQKGFDSISNIAKAYATNGETGAIIAGVGELFSWIGGLFTAHDDNLDERIQKSANEVKKLQNEYRNLVWIIERQLTKVTKEQSSELMANLVKQRQELERQRELEERKKKSDASKLTDYDQQIKEMNQQIADFYRELADSRYGINIDSWADQIASSITKAFAKGEDAAVAFKDTVADIMEGVVDDILKINVVKPAMSGLNELLFGITSTNSEEGIEISANEAVELAEALADLQDKVNSGKTIYDVVANAMRALGITSSSDTASKTLSASQKGTTEATSNLLASYVNAVRADMSAIRELIERSMGADESPIAQAQLQQLEVIARNTAQTADNTSSISDIFTILRRTVDGVYSFHVA